MRDGLMGRRASGAAFAAAALALGAPLQAGAAESVAGRLLVAEPELAGSPFAETVIMMIEHSDAGALGVVVNRPVDALALGDLVAVPDDAVGDLSLPLYSGGPVGEGALLALHDAGFEAEGTTRVADGIATTPVESVLEATAEGAGPDTLHLYAGYAGWAPGQLEAEFARDSWHVVPADPRLVFEIAPERIWDEASARRQREL